MLLPKLMESLDAKIKLLLQIILRCNQTCKGMLLTPVWVGNSEVIKILSVFYCNQRLIEICTHLLQALSTQVINKLKTDFSPLESKIRGWVGEVRCLINSVYLGLMPVSKLQAIMFYRYQVQTFQTGMFGEEHFPVGRSECGHRIDPDIIQSVAAGPD